MLTRVVRKAPAGSPAAAAAPPSATLVAVGQWASGGAAPRLPELEPEPPPLEPATTVGNGVPTGASHASTGRERELHARVKEAVGGPVGGKSTARLPRHDTLPAGLVPAARAYVHCLSGLGPSGLNKFMRLPGRTASADTSLQPG